MRLLLAGAMAAAAFHPTHSVTVSGQVVDRWTIDEPGDCGHVGGGSVTVDFAMKKPVKVDAHVDRYAGSEVAGASGRWVFVLPQGPFHQITDMKGQAARGTITRVDDTFKRARPADQSPCGPEEKESCGAMPLQDGFAYLNGYDRRRVTVDLGPATFDPPGFQGCLIGQLDQFSSPPRVAGGTSKGELRFKMPKASTLRRSKLVTVIGTSHKSTTYGSAGDTVTTDDVTRTVTVTFKRL